MEEYEPQEKKAMENWNGDERRRGASSFRKMNVLLPVIAPVGLVREPALPPDFGEERFGAPALRGRASLARRSEAAT